MGAMAIRTCVRGLLSYAPEFEEWASTRADGGITRSARCRYGVWLRHLIVTFQSGLSTTPQVAEPGPGESIGMGLDPLLCGVRAYTYPGCDRVRGCPQQPGGS